MFKPLVCCLNDSSIFVEFVSSLLLGAPMNFLFFFHSNPNIERLRQENFFHSWFLYNVHDVRLVLMVSLQKNDVDHKNIVENTLYKHFFLFIFRKDRFTFSLRSLFSIVWCVYVWMQSRSVCRVFIRIHYFSVGTLACSHWNGCCLFCFHPMFHFWLFGKTYPANVITDVLGPLQTASKHQASRKWRRKKARELEANTGGKRAEIRLRRTETAVNVVVTLLLASYRIRCTPLSFHISNSFFVPVQFLLTLVFQSVHSFRFRFSFPFHSILRHSGCLDASNSEFVSRNNAKKLWIISKNETMHSHRAEQLVYNVSLRTRYDFIFALNSWYFGYSELELKFRENQA